MLSALSRAIAQLSDPGLGRVVLVSVGGTLLLFVMLLMAVSWLLYDTVLFQNAWLEGAVDLLGGVAVFLLAWLLFPAVVLTLSSLMLEQVVKAVERRHYPHLGPARRQPMTEGIINAAKFLLVVILLNILLLPLLFVPPVYAVAYYSMNGYLLGREYYEQVASRRLIPDRMRYLRSEEGLRLFLAGFIIAFLSVIPFVNLLTPVIATAFMVHLFEEMRRGLPPPGGA